MQGRYGAQRVAKEDLVFDHSRGAGYVESLRRESMSRDRLSMHNAVVLRCVWSDDLNRSMDPARRRDEKHRRGAIAVPDRMSAETAELSSRHVRRASEGDQKSGYDRGPWGEFSS